MPDLVTFGESMLRYSPPDGERIERTETLEVRVAGAESNVAITAQRLGADVTWISKLPDSPLARRLVAPIRSHGVTASVVHGAGRQGVYYIEQAGKPRGTNVVYDRADAAITTATAEELPTAAIEAAEAFFTSGITPALSETLRETTADLLELARDAGTTTVFDLNYRSKLWAAAEARDAIESLLPAVDVLFLPERDARGVLDRSGTPTEILERLDDEFDFEAVILTRGAEGAIGYAAGTAVEQPAYEVETLDPVGTGDAFVGAYLARWLDGGTVAECLDWGAATAALKRTMPGDIAVVTPAEVEAVGLGSSDEISR